MGDIQMTPELMAFGGIATVAALAAVGVVLFNNTIRSALCLVLNFFLLAIVYFTLNAQFLGIIQIVVYTGAIMVLFLFVIMLLNLGSLNANTLQNEVLSIRGRLASNGLIGTFFFLLKKYFKEAIAAILGAGLFFLILGQIFLPMTSEGIRAPDDFGKPENLGTALFTGYVWPFELASFLLLIGIVGSILLAKRRMIPTRISNAALPAKATDGGDAE